MEQARADEAPISPRHVETPLKGHKKRQSTSNHDGTSPNKKAKIEPEATSPAENQPSRKGRACVACRKLKVKCDAWERGLSGCSRCQRLGIECINARRLRIAVEGEEG